MQARFGDAHVIDGTACDETLGDQLRVTVIATDLSRARRAESRTPSLSVVQPQQVATWLHTGTHNLPIQNQPVQPAQPGAADCTGLDTRSFWRNARSQASPWPNTSA